MRSWRSTMRSVRSAITMRGVALATFGTTYRTPGVVSTSSGSTLRAGRSTFRPRRRTFRSSLTEICSRRSRTCSCRSAIGSSCNTNEPSRTVFTSSAGDRHVARSAPRTSRASITSPVLGLPLRMRGCSPSRPHDTPIRHRLLECCTATGPPGSRLIASRRGTTCVCGAPPQRRCRWTARRHSSSTNDKDENPVRAPIASTSHATSAIGAGSPLVECRPTSPWLRQETVSLSVSIAAGEPRPPFPLTF